jgi:hypothetical protein
MCGKAAENYSLHPLCMPRCKLPAALYFRQVIGAKSAFAERSCQYVGGSDCVLDGKVDPDASNRRHGVCRIPDTNESGTIPAAKAIHSYFKQFRIVPVAHLGDAVVQERSPFDDRRAQPLYTLNLHFRRGSFRDYKPALPILAAVQRDERLATVGMNPKIGIIEVFGESHPQQINISTHSVDHQASALAQDRIPAVRRHDQVGPDFHWSVASHRAYACDSAVLLNKSLGFCLHLQMKSGKAASLRRKEAEKVPLRHKH